MLLGRGAAVAVMLTAAAEILRLTSAGVFLVKVVKLSYRTLRDKSQENIITVLYRSDLCLGRERHGRGHRPAHGGNGGCRAGDAQPSLPESRTRVSALVYLAELGQVAFHSQATPWWCRHGGSESGAVGTSGVVTVLT